VVVRELPQLVDPEYNCKPENRGKVLNTLLEPWKARYEKGVETAFTGLGEPAMLTIGDAHQNALFFNFMAHVQRTAMKSSLNFTVVNVALDTLAHKACGAIRDKMAEDEMKLRIRPQKRRGSWPSHSHGTHLKCVTLEGWLPADFFQHAEPAGVVGTGTCSYNMIIGTKPHIMKAAVQGSEHGVLLLDTDVVIKGDIIKESMDRLLLKDAASIVTGIENRNVNRINSGTVFTSKNLTFSRIILERWIQWNSEFLNDDHGDQAALQEVFFKDRKLWEDAAVTYAEAVGECSRPAPVAIHYNCYDNKLAPMKRQDDWDKEAQQAREQMGFRRLMAQDEVVQAKIQAMRAAGDWIPG